MLRAGFIGFGRMGITHYSILNGMPNVEAVAICEPSKTMQGVLGKYLDVQLYSDYRSMMDTAALDFIVVSTPPDSHAEIIDYALEKGIHFFVEKPLAPSVQDSSRIVEKLANVEICNQVGYVNRFIETFLEVKRMLDAGVIGEIKSFSSEMYSATVLKDASGGWRAKKKAGGGCMYEMASHCIDLAVYLFGTPSSVKGSVTQSIYSSNVEDLVSSTLVYEQGVTGRITVNWSDPAYRKPANIITVNGTKGKIIASKYHLKTFLLEARDDFDLKEGWNSQYMTDLAENVSFYVRGNEFSRQWESFIQNVEEKKQALSTCESALQTDLIIDAITEDAASSGGGVVVGGGTTAAASLPGVTVKKPWWKRLFSWA